MWQGADGVSTKLKEQMTCDCFTLWLTSQLIAFHVSKGYPAIFPSDHWEGVHFNRVMVSISDKDSDDGPAPVRGALSEMLAQDQEDGGTSDMEDCLVRAWSNTHKQATTGIWSTMKGSDICWDVPVEERAQVLQRDWRDASEWTTSLNRFGFLHGSNPFDRRFYCTDRVSLISGIDLVSFGPWRFFYIGNGNYAAAMDWDAAIDAGETNYGVFDHASNKAVVPGGTPLGPWHAHVLSKECGVQCPWEYPIPDPGEDGFRA